MMKKILMPLVMLIPFCIKGQVTVTVQLPPAGMIQRDQLWNVVAVNNTNEMLETSLSMTLQDAMTGRTFLSGATRNFTLGKGIKVLAPADVQPVQYNYVAAEFTSNYIPLGSYIVCYRIMRLKGDDVAPLADECVRLNISPLSPPVLNTPFDKTVVPTTYPQFTWLPPSPLEMFNNLTYDIAIAEVLEGQSASEAISSNAPVYVNSNLRTPFETYPPSFPALQPGKLYVWQVTAFNGSNYSAQTEPWIFSIKPSDSLHIPVLSLNYIVLRRKQEQAAISYIKAEELSIKYYSFDNDHETAVRFLAADGSVIHEVKRKIVYGENFLRFKLNNKFKKGSVYAIEIADQKNSIYSTRFSIQ